MLAQRLLGLMPPLEEAAALEVAAIESLAGIPFSPNVGVSAPSVLLIILVLLQHWWVVVVRYN